LAAEAMAAAAEAFARARGWTVAIAVVDPSSAGAVVLEGGLPVRVNGQVVGAIGVSGMTSSQDGEVAGAGLQALQV
jgi:uncharacterized protein GlcG (DUF336 family)